MTQVRINGVRHEPVPGRRPMESTRCEDQGGHQTRGDVTGSISVPLSRADVQLAADQSLAPMCFGTRLAP